MFKIKICGVTSVADGKMIAEAGADAIGLNFYSPSPRSTDLQTADEIIRNIPENITKVGVFVDSTCEDICRIFDHLQLDYIQLHGDQPVDFTEDLGDRPFIRAFRCQDYDMGPALTYIDQCRKRAISLEAILLDAYQPGLYGGTGKTVDWHQAGRELNSIEDAHVVLSGGLNPVNVAEAVTTVRPFAVDTASGVESSPGLKDLGLMKKFVHAAQESLAKIND